MQTEAVFENIADRIQTEIRNAQKSIFIAVAWFTNKNLFNELVLKAKSGCPVSLIIADDKINSNAQIPFSELEKYNSKYYKVGNGDTELMHNKFCVIDFSTVITGSYNWSYKAEINFENVIINYNDTALAEQFISEFEQIRKKFYPDEQKEEIIFPINKILIRLEIIKNYILLEDIDELNKETHKLNEFIFNSDIAEIINHIQNNEYSFAVNKIQNFAYQNNQISIWSDPEIPALKLEIKNLENRINAFDNEKVELEKIISDFQYRHTIELGSIILEILKLRKLKFKTDKKKYAEAESDYKQFNKQFEEEKKKQQFKLTEEEKMELKKKFRKATFLCHPDKVNDKFKEEAQKIFIELKAAYEANDLMKVSKILNNLEKNNFFKPQSETVSEKDKLKTAIAKLLIQIKTLVNEIVSIKQSETFNTIVSITDWDNYFRVTKEKLEKELQDLQI
jgi:hypothetical protein